MTVTKVECVSYRQQSVAAAVQHRDAELDLEAVGKFGEAGAPQADRLGIILVARAESDSEEGLARLMAQIDEQLSLSGLERGESVGH